MGSRGVDPATEQPATVLVGQEVKAGRDGDYRRWQQQVSETASQFPGFRGTEVNPPVGGGREWTVIYRFDSVPHLQSWLNSRKRQELLDRGSDLFAGPASQQVMAPTAERELVTVVVTHRVDPALEEEFQVWQERMTEAEREFPGFRGAEIFRPVPGVQEDWTAIYRFNSGEELEAWLSSERRRRLLDEGREFKDFHLRRVESSFGNWFAFEDRGEKYKGPGDFKTSIAVWVGLYPTVMLLTLGLDELLPGFKLWQALLLGNLLSSFIMTYLTMPHYTNRVLRFWLAPDPDGSPRRTNSLGILLSLVLLAFWAAVFWLTTTVIWSLPSS